VIPARRSGNRGWRDSGVVGDAPQQTSEFSLFGAVQGRGEVRVVCVGGSLGFGEQNARAVGEDECVRAAVVRMTVAFDELSLFELVNELDHLVAVQAHGVGELLLGGAVCVGELAEQLEVAGAEAERREAFSEPVGGTEPELGQQQPDPFGERGLAGALRQSGHATKR
jgi:hypothetical protein